MPSKCPVVTYGKENLSFHALNELCKDVVEIRSLVDDFDVACEPVRVYRNKLVGHNDLTTKLLPHENPIPGIGRKNIENIVSLACQILNLVYGKYTKGELVFELVAQGDAKSLLYWLRIANETETNRISRLGNQ